jgi:S-adenosylmethionine:tRNA ribosyltransferase-isomerase
VKFYRHQAEVALRPRGTSAVLKTDEVSRHAVRLVVVPRVGGEPQIVPFARLAELLRAGDLVVVNDAATLPASLAARSERGERLELRLSGPVDGNRLYGVVFGAGDWRTRTEDRLPPPPLAVGEVLRVGKLATRIAAIAGRRIELVARESEDALWQGLYDAGRAVQYAHRPEPMDLWTVQTAYASRPWAAEMPSAGRALTWDVLLSLRRAGIRIARLTHAAGLSSTGDDALDRALPWPERYELPRATVDAIAETRARGGRVIAIGTTVVRALESAALEAGLGAPSDAPAATPVSLRAGSGIATLRLDAAFPLRVVDGIVSGLHAPGESHFELLQAFAPRDRLVRAIDLAAGNGLSSHELGDACVVL